MMPPISMLVSMTVLTVAVWLPTLDTTPTSTPVEVMTQFPGWSPASSPLLRVRVERQLSAERAVTLADSKVRSRRLDRRPSSSRSRAFS